MRIEMKQAIKKILEKFYKIPYPWRSKFDRRYLVPEVPLSNKVSHQKWQKYLYELGNKPGMRILEIGSREVTGKSNARKEF
jgi:hypothetical protein